MQILKRRSERPAAPRVATNGERPAAPRVATKAPCGNGREAVDSSGGPASEAPCGNGREAVDRSAIRRGGRGAGDAWSAGTGDDMGDVLVKEQELSLLCPILQARSSAAVLLRLSILLYISVSMSLSMYLPVPVLRL